MQDVKDKNQDHFVFVYGTLRRGGSNAFRMDGAEFIVEATVRGRLFRVDWYPGLLLDAGAGAVVGDVFRVPDTQLPRLDAYEGPEYRRVQVEASWADGNTCRVWLWEWCQPVDGLREVASGDWLAEGA